MTHTHVAGAIHGDVNANPGFHLMSPPEANALNPKVWSCTAVRTDSGVVEVGGLSVSEIAEQVGTPAYVLDEEDFRTRAREFRNAFHGWRVYYAGKALLTRTIVRWINEEELFLDVATGGELAVALSAGIDPARIAMHGNNKSIEELTTALSVGVGRIVCDSMNELSRIEQLASENQWQARVLIRVTAGVEAHTHEYIATAHEDQKFGLSISNGQAMVALVRCHVSDHIDLRGIHSHIGSQIFDTQGFEVAARRLMKLRAQFAQATGTVLPEMCIGGGFGIAYTSADSPATPEQLAHNLREIITSESTLLGMELPEVSIEPGRAISGPTTMMLYRVGTVKPVDLDGGQQRLYVSVDGGMSDNIRTALYNAEYTASIVSRASEAPVVLARIVGKHCEAGDIVVRDVYLPGDISPGDLVAVPASGAYSRSMASNYNHVPRPPVVAVNKGQIQTLIRRETIEDLLQLDVGE